MKKIILLTLIVVMSAKITLASAAITCTTNKGQSASGPGGTVYASASLDAAAATKNDIVFTTRLKCTNDSVRETIRTGQTSIPWDSSLLPGGYPTITINGRNYRDNLVTKGDPVITLGEGETGYINISVRMSYVNPSKKENVAIKKDKFLGIYKFLIDYQNGTEGEFIISVSTEDDVIVRPAFCSINNSQTIDVPFGEVRQDLITSSDKTPRYKVTREFKALCDTPINQMLKVKLVADPSPFSERLIKTSNPDIGIEFYWQDVFIKPGDYFLLITKNGSFNTVMDFILRKNSNIDPLKIATGDLSGSATLIVSTP